MRMYDMTSAVLKPAGVTAGDVASLTPLTGGTYNTVTRVRLTDGRSWVVKVPPPATTGALMRYEHGLLAGEVTYYRAASSAGEPAAGVVPQILHHSLAPTGTGPFLVMSDLPGQPWNEIADTLTETESCSLRRGLGRIVAQLHTVTGPGGFGYPAEPFGPPVPTWRRAFTAMTGAVLADAETYRPWLPRPVAEIRAVLDAAAPVLDGVTRPALVHFDLWQGNILVTGGPGARRVGGVIDGERMFWGDPAADFVPLALLGDLEEDADFLTGYAEQAGRPVVFDASLRLRLALYRSYLYLIMLVETVPRQTPDQHRAWLREEVGPRLCAALDAVGSSARPPYGEAARPGEGLSRPAAGSDA